jgi:hypothetical protein
MNEETYSQPPSHQNKDAKSINNDKSNPMSFLLEEAKHESSDIKIMNFDNPAYNRKNSSETYKPQCNEASGFRDFKREPNYPKRARDTQPIIFKNPFENNTEGEKKKMHDPFNPGSNLGMRYSCKSDIFELYSLKARQYPKPIC